LPAKPARYLHTETRRRQNRRTIRLASLRISQPARATPSNPPSCPPCPIAPCVSFAKLQNPRPALHRILAFPAVKPVVPPPPPARALLPPPPSPARSASCSDDLWDTASENRDCNTASLAQSRAALSS